MRNLTTVLVAVTLAGCASTLVPGAYVLSTPRAERIDVEIRALKTGEYYLSSQGQPFCGVYKLNDTLLEMSHPDQPRDSGYVWQRNDETSLTLLREPEFVITGVRLVSSTLTKK